MDESGEDLIAFRNKHYQIIVPIFLIICIFAVIANAIVINALRMTRVRNATVTLILSLTISDIWTSSIVACSLLYNSYLPIVKGTYPNPCFSLTLEMLRTGGLITGTLHLLLISVHHYIGIIRPYTDKQKLRTVASALCVIAWLSPLAVLFGLASFIPEQGYHDCMNVEFYHSRLFRMSISGLLILIFLFITWCYFRLIIILRSQAHHWKASRSAQKRVSRENKTLTTTILICSSFFIGWAPATIHFTITCDTCELLKEQKFRVLFFFSCIQLSFILGKSLLNPLIYSIRIPEIEQQLEAMKDKYWAPIRQTICFQSRKSSSLKCPSIRRNLVNEGVLERPSSTEDQSRAVLSTVDSPMKISVYQNGETLLTPKEDKSFDNLLTDNTEYL
uniref:G-protein coupled receptors family 1 profile domain-containing protein n=1 Tax=Panagrolaimus sp. PS1159 TaxID=55785 RepID=A0AC35FPS6_9BILA